MPVSFDIFSGKLVYTTNSSGGSSPSYPEVNTYADLPSPPPDPTKHIYVVLNATGAWYTFNRKDSGMYFWNGSTWNILDQVPYYFASSSFRVQDGSNNTKQLAFDTSNIPTGTTVTIIVPQKDIDLRNVQMSRGAFGGFNS